MSERRFRLYFPRLGTVCHRGLRPCRPVGHRRQRADRAQGRSAAVAPGARVQPRQAARRARQGDSLRRPDRRNACDAQRRLRRVHRAGAGGGLGNRARLRTRRLDRCRGGVRAGRQGRSRIGDRDEAGAHVPAAAGLGLHLPRARHADLGRVVVQGPAPDRVRALPAGRVDRDHDAPDRGDRDPPPRLGCLGQGQPGRGKGARIDRRRAGRLLGRAEEGPAGRHAQPAREVVPRRRHRRAG